MCLAGCCLFIHEMKSLLIPAAVIGLASPAMAGTYINGEVNASLPGGSYTGSVIETHVGQEFDLGEDGGVVAAFDRGEHPIKDAEVGVAGTGVVETGGVAVGKGAGGEDRRHHGAGVAREAVAVMNHPGAHTFAVAVLQCR